MEVVVILFALLAVGYAWGRWAPRLLRVLLVLLLAVVWLFWRSSLNHDKMIFMMFTTPLYPFFFGAFVGSLIRDEHDDTSIFSRANLDWMLLFGGLATMFAFLHFFPPPSPAARKACINNLRMIELAKEQYAEEYGITNAGAQLRWDNLAPYITNVTNKVFCPTAPAAMRSLANYTINPIGSNPVCNIVGPKGEHTLYD